MFETLKAQKPDAILALMQMYRDDPRDHKVDLGVGVYKDAAGVTPVMRAIKAAEEKLWQEQDSKSYVGLAGDAAFNDAMVRLVLGDAIARSDVASVATPGGTGAVRQAFELIKLTNPNARVFVSNPTWPNHLSILEYLGIETVPYRYFDTETRGVDFEGMLADLSAMREGDVVLLHGCCHNPTGANLTFFQIKEIIQLILTHKATPMIDIAYQGFGDGVEADAAITRAIAAAVPECLIAASCSKNFGIYRERTGILMLATPNGGDKALRQGTLAFLNRQNYSFPPDHGARLVTMILEDDALRADWLAELEEMRTGMLSLREQLAKALEARSGSNRFGFLAEHRGMFSRLGTTPELVQKMREDHAIYMVGDSRMNIAGLNEASIPVLADAIIAAGV